MTLLKVQISQALVAQDPSSKLLTVVSSAAVYLRGTSTLATLYSNSTGTSLSNPVPTGVTPSATEAGLDTNGNLVIWVDPGSDYEVLVNGIRVPLSTPPVHGSDTSSHIASTSDPHSSAAQAMAYADANFLNKTTDITGIVTTVTQTVLANELVSN